MNTQDGEEIKKDAKMIFESDLTESQILGILTINYTKGESSGLTEATEMLTKAPLST